MGQDYIILRGENADETYIYRGPTIEVTGSCHFLEVGNTKVLIDCGMEQGNNIYQNAELP